MNGYEAKRQSTYMSPPGSGNDSTICEVNVTLLSGICSTRHVVKSLASVECRHQTVGVQFR